MSPNPPVSGPMQLLRHYGGATLSRYRKLGSSGKIFVWLLITFYICIALFIILVTPARIAQFMYDSAQKIKDLEYGWLILSAAIVAVSFPPMLGHTALIELCGFTYGLQGFVLAISASVVGSAIVFTILRYLFSRRLREWTTSNEQWQALEDVVRERGFPLIALIRISSFPPWVYSNSLFASIESVSLTQFILATVCISPKFFLNVFIGSRIASLSDGEQRDQMDTQTKIINSLLVISGFVVSALISLLVYRVLRQKIRSLHASSSSRDVMAAEALERAEEEPLLQAITV